ncbi:hypothetical protein [Pantoea sp. B270]
MAQIQWLHCAPIKAVPMKKLSLFTIKDTAEVGQLLAGATYI